MTSWIYPFGRLVYPAPEAGDRTVADRPVAMHALDLAAVVRAGDLLVHEASVTRDAVVLQDAARLGRDHDRLVKILQRERLRVVIAVLRLGDVLPDQAVRKVAGDAGRDRVVARFLPGVVLRLHDVAVDADLRVVAHVREPLGVEEGEPADAG